MHSFHAAETGRSIGCARFAVVAAAVLPCIVLAPAANSGISEAGAIVLGSHSDLCGGGDAANGNRYSALEVGSVAQLSVCVRTPAPDRSRCTQCAAMISPGLDLDDIIRKPG